MPKNLFWVWISVIASSTLAAAQTAPPPDAAACVIPDQELAQQFAAARAALQSSTQAKPIYGCDDRKDLFDPRLTEPQKRAAQATALVVSKKEDRIELCSPEQAAKTQAAEPERFWDQPQLGGCSSFKVGPKVMATAGHCIQSLPECRKTRFIFGYHMLDRNSRPDQAIPKTNVYQCVALIGGSFSEDDPTVSDWRLVEVDRIIDAPTVAIRTAATKPPLTSDTAVTVIGYPLGLPVKIADEATVRSIEKKKFVANLDTYGGNSGSVVLNSELLARNELLAEGILVGGANDFQLTGQKCVLSAHCPDKGCSGEKVTAISEIADALKKANR
ncbi:trypsin-like serine peptidase [Bradyrhizobium diazoefficiens]|uniref:Serine protease n=1 Tax=Bradyrhizobium diazoefficiens TaxID=1355477 RepID=A0A809YDD7_9BRAD|nr:trypsin-like peptidase domain-containing protein [Bradyrhizobium diazoefficiens]BBZ99863.1 hypothetical protein H12S4_07680 [Bradyrhizobium diazoefficiens]BCA17547.1 hypothetical protein BDHH15_07620 [Bradyrhizobium diazoefficiens]BCE35731.1 hypothetical protein XF3B_07620 [Bradyrhizobium diazoefficiens]BCF49124.1 hypothetical protein XF17B_07620 [Bradyrhizobium diazoefficiens]